MCEIYSREADFWYKRGIRESELAAPGKANLEHNNIVLIKSIYYYVIY